MLRRVLDVAALRLDAVEQLEADPEATGQAATVVGISAAIAGLPALARLDYVAFVIVLLAAFLGWVVWSETTRFFGASLFGGHASRFGMLRVMGFALAPIAFAAWTPATTPALVWVLVSGTAAVGRTMRLNWWRAVATASQGYLIYLAGLIVVGGLF